MKNKYNKIAVIGLGYIGLPTAAVFASRKKQVIGVDVNEGTVNTINKGEIHIVEPKLDEAVSSAVKKGFLKASLVPESSDAFIIAVPTPFKGNHEPDLSFIYSAIKEIAPYLKKGNLIVLESTSPVGTTEKMCDYLSGLRPDLTFPNQNGNSSDVKIAHCPERVLPGKIMKELVENDRVIGGLSKSCTNMAVDLYKTFVTGECIKTSAKTAEMCKLTENACRDVQIAFANELSMICDEQHIDPWELIELANRHPRINILKPGPGVGGHCIAVDPWFIISTNPVSSRLLKSARRVNSLKPEWVLNKIMNEIENYSRSNSDIEKDEIIISCFGLAYKPNVDDFRESPALEIVSELSSKHQGKVLSVEPFMNNENQKFEGIEIISCEEAKEISDIAVILVNHDQFKSLENSYWTGFKVIDISGLSY